MSPPVLGAVLGLVAGLGLLTVLLRAPLLRPPTLDDRLAPYLREAAPPSRLLSVASVAPLSTLRRLLAPVLADGVRALEHGLGGSASVRRRLERAGGQTALEEFRAQQVLWGAGALLATAALSLLVLAGGGGRSPWPFLVLCLLAGVGGVLGRDRWLQHEVARREQRIMAEFPTVAELLALAVGAGESTVGALERVTRISRGELPVELGRALAEARAGAPLAVALQGIAARTGLPPLARFVDGVAVALERGTPLADVLRAQAADAREAGKRALLEAGGRKEIAMMVPVVFLVLPTTVVFALFPGFLGFSVNP